MKKTINDIVPQLETGAVTFTFTKKDGTLREIRATRNPQIIGRSVMEANDKVVTVWDIAENNWRSIRNGTEIVVS